MSLICLPTVNREEETVSKSVRFSLRDTPRRLSSWRMEDGLDVQNTYISVGCNRNPYSLDWGLNHLNGLVAFAACNSLALYMAEVCSLCPVQLDIGMLD